MIGAHVSVRPNASRNASIPYRSLNWSTMVLAVGAAHGPEPVVAVVLARRLLPGEVHHPPTKLVTVTPESRTWSIHRLALNFGGSRAAGRRSPGRPP